MRWHKLTRAVEAQIAEGRIQLLEALADRHVRTDDQNGIGEAVIPGRRNAIENGPRSKHPHDRRLAGAGRHFAGIAHERADTRGLGLKARFVLRGFRDALPINFLGLDQEYDRLGGLDLRKEEPLHTLIAAPQVQQLTCHGRNTVIGEPAAMHAFTPVLHPLADCVDDSEFDLLALLALEHFALREVAPPPPGVLRHPVEIARPPPSLSPDRRLAPLNLPVALRLAEGRVDDRRFDLGNGQGRLLFLCGGHQAASSAPLTTINSLPRSSMTLTAMRFLPPRAKGSLAVPAKCSQTLSSNCPLSDF